ncbi:hypothetical protein SAMN05216188_101438 [Lentzea xinjiangensis]|uniref:Uncharacterized protein n=1 Tax=Lentzea xinjiangensis TaxID=402600 RepID=A0A1H9AK86_9PSEU|nr:hypothetical protein [Lentzea xinjiangensis]SEP77192.1 hypothetical protein SAMN05216188_101438 [Lentzea xinjiangensis]
MSEQEIREGMLLAVWDEPPLDFDPDKLIRRVEQKKSRRRALVAVGVATAMIAVVSLSLPGLLPRGDDSQLAADQPVVSSAPVNELTRKKAQRIGDRLAEQLSARMTNLKDVSATLDLGAVYGYPPYAPTTTRKSSDPKMSGYVFLTDQIGPTALRVEAVENGSPTRSTCGGAIMCRDVKQADGSLVTEAEFAEGGPDISRAEAVRRFGNGYAVTISSHNYNPASGSGLRQTVPVRVEVLTALLMDESIDWE